MPDAVLGLGLDVGGTQMRWALVGSEQRLVAEGSVAAFSAVHLGDEAGRRRVNEALADLAQAVAAQGPLASVRAGVTGFDAAQEATGQTLQTMLAQHLRVRRAAVVIGNDIELACLAAFAPGLGYLVCAGTGSIAGFIDESGGFHRAGGRGGLLDDGGSGYWIAMEALRHVWRAEDEAPGHWVDSAMARALFERIGGSDWSLSRALIYGASRGQIGLLALAVAATAEVDPHALAILQRAGHELARLGNAIAGRFGARPIALGGRVAQLHPSIEQSMRRRLAPDCELRRVQLQAHIAAARLAACFNP